MGEGDITIEEKHFKIVEALKITFPLTHKQCLFQVEFSNVILLNKTDLVSAETLARVKSAVRSLNAGAEIIETKQSVVDLKYILDTGKRKGDNKKKKKKKTKQ